MTEETKIERITNLDKEILTEILKEVLEEKSVVVNQSIDHVKCYTEAEQVISKNLPKFTDFLTEVPTNDEKGFNLTKKWFLRLGFKEVMLSENIYNNQTAFKTAKFKTVSNEVSKLKSFLNGLSFDQAEELEESEAKTLLLASLFLRPERKEGKKSTGKVEIKIIDEEKRPELKGNRKLFLEILENHLDEVTEVKQLETDFMSEMEGISTFQANWQKIKQVLAEYMSFEPV